MFGSSNFVQLYGPLSVDQAVIVCTTCGDPGKPGRGHCLTRGSAELLCTRRHKFTHPAIHQLLPDAIHQSPKGAFSISLKDGRVVTGSTSVAGVFAASQGAKGKGKSPAGAGGGGIAAAKASSGGTGKGKARSGGGGGGGIAAALGTVNAALGTVNAIAGVATAAANAAGKGAGAVGEIAKMGGKVADAGNSAIGAYTATRTPAAADPPAADPPAPRRRRDRPTLGSRRPEHDHHEE